MNTIKRIVVRPTLATLLLTLSILTLVGCDKKTTQRAETTPTDPGSVTKKEGVEQEETSPKEEKKEDAAPDVHELKGDYYSVYSFLDNRPLAHEIHGSTVDGEAKNKSFTRYIWGNHANQWKENVVIDGQHVIALDKRRDGSLSVPSPVEHPNALILRLYNPVENAKNDLKVKINGHALKPQSLTKGWNLVFFELKEGEGGLENTLDLEFTGLGRIDGSLSGGAIAGFEIGTVDHAAFTEKTKDHNAAEPLHTSYGLAATQGALELKGGTGAMWYAFNVPKTSLQVSIKGEAGCGVTLHLEQAKDGKLTQVLNQEVKLTQETRSAAFPVTGSPHDVSRLIVKPIEGCEKVTIESLQLVAQGKKPARKTFEPPKHILVWMIDTLRSDHLPIHFPTDVQAPNLKRLADEGASFKWGIVQGNESKTSHASFFTGMYPNRHRVLAKGTLKPEQELMPEALKKSGYTTAAYMGNGYISQPWGFVQGWDFYRNNLREQLGISAAGLRKDAESWMSKNLDKKFFIYVGTIDPHVSYRAHQGLIEKYADADYKGSFKDSCSGETLGKIKGNPEKVSPEDRKQIQALYKNEIEYNDQEFGKLRAFMEEKGLWENTMVIITADHGDEFWEHGSVGHGHSVYDELVHVPIIMYYPPAIDAGVKPETGADVLDIYPTLVDIAGGQPVDGVQGHSLLPVMNKETITYPDPGIATRYLSHYAVQVGPWSYLLRRGDFELFNNDQDLTEQHNVAQKHPFETRALTDATSLFLVAPKEWEKLTWGTPTNLSPNFLTLLNNQKK